MILFWAGLVLAKTKPCTFELTTATVEHLFYDETAAEKPLCVSVVSPFEAGEQPLRAVVMLHGLGDTPDGWVREGVVELWISAMANGQLPPMRLVLPQGDRGYWTNGLKGNKRYREWLLQVLESLHEEGRIHRSENIAMGFSMGGHGALSVGLEHPEIFSTILALSPTDLSLAVAKQPRSTVYTSIFGNPVHLPFVASIEPREWLLRGAGKSQRIVIVVGADEPEKFLRGAQRLAALRDPYDINLELLVVPEGCHCWTNTWGESSQLWLIEQIAESHGSPPPESQ